MENLVKALAALLLTSCLTLSPVFAQESPSAPEMQAKPTEESLRRLLEIMQARKLVDNIPKQVDAMFTTMIKQSLEGKALTTQQQQALDSMRDKVLQMMRDEFNWESMESLYLKVYADTFSQSEIDSMIGFYSSPAGHAVILKLPLAMQNSMAEMQKKMAAMMPKIQQMAKDTAEEIKAQQKSAPKSSGG
jgi:hypothetical protein